MGTEIVKGTLQLQLNRIESKSDPSHGYVVDYLWRGTDLNNALAQAYQYIYNGISVTLIQEFGIYTLQASDATQSNPIDTWELIGDAERKDLFQNPRLNEVLAAESGGSIAPPTPDEMAAIRSHLANEDAPSLAFSAAGNITLNTTPPITVSLVRFAGTVIYDAYARYQAGESEFENDAYAAGYVLKHTTNAPARWTQNISDFRVGQVYSTANLLTEVTDSSLWVLPIPPRLYFKINLLGTNAPAAVPFFFWGWKKSRSTEETAANNRVNIVQHYTLELWSADDYQVFA